MTLGEGTNRACSCCRYTPHYENVFFYKTRYRFVTLPRTARIQCGAKSA